VGSQTHKKPRPKKGGRKRKLPRGQQTLPGPRRSVDELVQSAKELVEKKEFKFAANVTAGVALKVSGTDLLADAVIAGAKGYDEALKHGPVRGAERGATELAKRRLTGAVADAVAAKAVGSVGGLAVTKFGKEIVRDAIASTIEELSDQASGET
jgi:hypothetical protein